MKHTKTKLWPLLVGNPPQGSSQWLFFVWSWTSRNMKKHLKQKTGCTRSVPTNSKWSEITSIYVGFFPPPFIHGMFGHLKGPKKHPPNFTTIGSYRRTMDVALLPDPTVCQHHDDSPQRKVSDDPIIGFPISLSWCKQFTPKGVDRVLEAILVRSFFNFLWVAKCLTHGHGIDIPLTQFLGRELFD